MEHPLERLVLSGLILAMFALAATGVAALARRAIGKRLIGGRYVGSPGPTLLYFWSADCSSCAYQERQIEEAAQALALQGTALLVRKIDAIEHTALAQSMNVVTLPTTVLLDIVGNVVAWNPGVRAARTIVSQVEMSRR